MDTNESIRDVTFTHARRGYDRREVDNYLAKLAERLEGRGPNKVHTATIKQELERIGQKTGKILTAAEEAGQSLRADAEQSARKIKEDANGRVASIKTSADKHAKRVREEAQAFATKTRAEAEAHSKQLRSEAEGISARAHQDAEAQSTKFRDEADGYAKRVRSEADAHAVKVVKKAEDKAIQIVEEGTMRRRGMEKVIADLEMRRDAVVGGLEKLSNQLHAAASVGESRGDSPADVTPPGTNVKPPDTTGNSRPPDPRPVDALAGSQAPPSAPPPPATQ